MKVLQINSVCGIGSTGRIATDIHNILIEQGHESYIAYGRDMPRSCDNAIRIGSKFDNYVHVAKTRLLDKHGFGSKKATVAFIEKVKELDPDVIHLHNIHGYYINIEILFNYLKESKKPVVWTLHDCWAFTGHCAHFDHIKCDKWKMGCFDCQQKQSYPASILKDNSINNYIIKKKLFTGIESMIIVTPSSWLARLVKESFLREYRLTIINNGIDLDVFKPTESTFRTKYGLENKFIILGVANVWTEKKGIKYFLELSKKLKDDEVIVLVGIKENQKKYIPDNIVGITRTDNVRELAEIYSAADVFVNPTLQEVLGLTNIEAIACGTPVITFNTGGSIECIDNFSGYIIEKGNANKLLMAIRKIKIKGKSEYTFHCKKRAKLFYDKKNKFNEYIEVYKDIGEFK